MAPKPMPWFRFYVEALHDRKLRRLKPEHRWLFVAVLGAARQSPTEGYLLLSEHESLQTADLSDIAAMPERTVNEGMGALNIAGLVEWDHERSCWHVTNWDKRQYPSDRSAERVTKHRSSNGDVTAYRPPKERPNVADATPPETETETETEPDSHSPSVELALVNDPPPAAGYSEAFEEWWSWYPRAFKKGKGDAYAKWKIAVRANGEAPLLKAIQLHALAWEASGETFIPNPATWLHQKRYDDPPPVPKPKVNGRTDDNLAKIQRGLERTRGAS